MTSEQQDPGERIEQQADNLEDDLGRLEDRLDDAKSQLEERKEDAVGPGEAEDVAGDWEDEAPDRPGGDDPA